MYTQSRGNPKRNILRRSNQVSSNTMNETYVSSFTGPSTKELMNKHEDISKKKNSVKCNHSKCGD